MNDVLGIHVQKTNVNSDLDGKYADGILMG